jgi:hypothetical protein
MAISFTTRIIFLRRTSLGNCHMHIKKMGRTKSEQKNPQGAGYYFWAITCILKEDLEKGFLLMHQALEEDRKNVNSSYIQRRTTLAYSFVILDYKQQNQLFRKKVLEMAEFVEQRLNNYQTRLNRSKMKI